LVLLVSAVEVRTQLLGMAPLARLAMSGEGGDAWFEARPESPEAWRERIAEVRRSVPNDWLEHLRPAFAASGAAKDRLERVMAAQGVVVTTGQQPGLFGGPIYTWSKALSALALADALEAATGVAVAPVFWAATDDSDFAEASWTIVNGAVGAARLVLPGSPTDGVRLVDVPLGDVGPLMDEVELAGGSAADPRPFAAMRDAYRTDVTLGGAYVELLRTLLEPLGIAVLDAGHPAVPTAGTALLRRALADHEQVAAALSSRDQQLRAGGFEPQVAEMRDLSLVFSRSNGARRRVPFAEAASLAASANDGELSPNVLLRPVIERAILPTVAYAAGPGELSYFAQVSAVAESLGAGAPLGVPRWSGLLIEPHVAQILSRHEIRLEELEHPQGPETRLARTLVSPDVVDTLEAARAAVRDHLAHVRDALRADGRGPIPEVADGAERAMLWRLTRLERRILAGVKRRESELMAQLEVVRGALRPLGLPQERALNLLPILARHGLEVLDDMLAAARAHADALVRGAPRPAQVP
jgi:bacillithiol synthase